MCGIAGLCARFPVQDRAVSRMTDLMAHRGPDDGGLWRSADGRSVLGHCRLAIIDTTQTGHQPMERSGLVTVFNGEIYNYRELRVELAGTGAAFLGGSDTEVLLRAYERWGPDCVRRLNGMFAFAIFDPRRGQLFCARDRYGEKPFLFAAGRDFFAFASEYKALLALEGVDRGLNEPLVLSFLKDNAHGLDDRRETAFRGIRQMLPGETLTLDLESLDWRTDRYWDLKPQAGAAEMPFEDAVAHFRDLLSDSVKLRLRSDVPVGSCLSGGLDSSSIVCLARQQLATDSPYHVFTGRFPGTEADEWARAQLTVEATGTESHVTVPTAEGMLADLDRFIWFNELPVGSTSQYAQYCVFRLAAQSGITVLMDGQGADELLGGYEQYFRLYLASLPAAKRRSEAERIRARYPLALATVGQSITSRLPEGMRRTLGRMTGRGSDVVFGLSREAAAMLPEPSIPRPVLGNPLMDGLYHDSFISHLPALLRYGDRNSMAHSREVRLPFCDHRLAEFALSLPVDYLMGDTQTKRLLREAMRGLLPEGVRTHWAKQGFRPPQEAWFSEALLARVEAQIEDPSFDSTGWWNRPWWQSVVRRFKGGEHHLAWVLWRPFIAQSWVDHFLTPIRRTKPVSVGV